MNFWNRLRRKQPQLASLPEVQRDELREFVYIDDISVQSLLASRTGAIATDYTDSQTSGTKRSRGANAGLNHGPASLGFNTAREDSVGMTSQVVRQSNAQARFKALRDMELERLMLRVTAPDLLPGTAGLAPDGQVVPLFERTREQQRRGVEEKDVCRGKLFELDIELEAEPIYGVTAAIASLVALFEQAPELVAGEGGDGIRQANAIAGMLDQLLTGLVPVRGRAVDYSVLHQDGSDYIIHNSLVAQLPEADRGALQPLVVVGVAERELFWKDLRRVLFAGHRYTVLARVADDGLPNSWQPIKLVDLVKQVSPELAQTLGSATSGAFASLGRMSELAHIDVARTQGHRALDRYRELLAEELGVEPEEAKARCQGLEDSEVSTDREAFRDAARAVTDRLTAGPDGGLSPERLSTLRDEAWRTSLEADDIEPERPAPAPAPSERYLNAEFVAIYW